MTALELSTEDFRRLAANVVELCAVGAESERIFDLDLPERGMGDQAFAALTDVIGPERLTSSVHSRALNAPDAGVRFLAT